MARFGVLTVSHVCHGVPSRILSWFRYVHSYTRGVLSSSRASYSLVLGVIPSGQSDSESPSKDNSI